MAFVKTLEIYEILREKLNDEDAKVVAKAIEKSLEQYGEAQKDTLATKLDLANLETRLTEKIANSKAEIIKWMFIFWVGQFAIMTATIFAMLKLFFK